MELCPQLKDNLSEKFSVEVEFCKIGPCCAYPSQKGVICFCDAKWNSLLAVFVLASSNKAEKRRMHLKNLQSLLTGTDVMITIFCDFWQFSAKKLAFFSKTNVMINWLCFQSKTPIFFAKFFGENI
jgi:hypothetical protein